MMMSCSIAPLYAAAVSTTNVKDVVNKFPATREAALGRLAEFRRAAVADYARTRNFVTAGHDQVSRLSAALRHRLISEEEVLAAVLAEHRFPAVEKFVQEVVWRTYWKGWLEQHPGVWEDYRRQSGGLVPVPPSGGAMDRFTEELDATGYLHNHARMWWAAWWCHQHGLPWAAGARFFFDRLIDADAASNTLGWRWVAGLQTAGKPYLARRDNLAKYWTDHGPLDGLDDGVVARIPAETADRSRVPLTEYPEVPPPGDVPVAWVGHADDLSIETTPLGNLRPVGVALIDHVRETDREAKKAWRRAAMDDAAARWSRHYEVEIGRLDRWDGLMDWVDRVGCGKVVLMAPFAGPEADGWRPVRAVLQAAGVEVTECRRAWDTRHFPAARAGFFPFWHKTRSALMKQPPRSAP